MADIALGSVGKIFEVGLAIKEAVETVQQNKENCLEIEKRVVRVTGILSRLEKTKMMDDQAMRGALEDLEETLRQALTLVTACQERHIVCLFCKAKDLSKQLRRVQDDIMQKTMLGVFATNVHITITLTNIEGAPPTTPPQPQVAGACSSGGAVDSRIKTDIKDNSVLQAECGMPFASLHGLTKFSLAELTDATYNFSQDNLIGLGGSSAVFKGALQGRLVAIKRLNNSAELSLKEMPRELRLISIVEHKNIVKCLGYAHEVRGTLAKTENNLSPLEETQFFLVQEFMPNGDLEKINCGTLADWSARLRLIHGLAEGVKYLHGQNIIHMDLKPSNILLDSDMNAKITDFGISRSFGASTTHEIINTDLMGTMGYMAPEYIFNSEISFKADVYAFGIILLGTIIGGMCRIGDHPPSSGRALVQWAIEAGGNLQPFFSIDQTLLDDIESQLDQIEICLRIGLSCTDLNQYNRPSMAQVVDKLPVIKDGRTQRNASLLRRLNNLTSGGRHK